LSTTILTLATRAIISIHFHIYSFSYGRFTAKLAERRILVVVLPGARVHVPVYVADFSLGRDGSHFQRPPALPLLEAPWQVRRYPKKVVHRRFRATDL
jgi:hypothetical protein